MIVLNLENVKSVEEKIEKYEEMINVPNCKCPNCSGSEFIYYGTYERNVLYVDKTGKIVEKRIKIKRIKCKECGMTHAIIPDFVVPYKQHVLELMNEVLEIKIVDGVSDQEIEEKFGVTRQLRLHFQKSLQKYKSKLSTFYQERNIKEIIKKVKEEEKIIQKFYIEYREIFLMMRSKAIYEYIPT